MNILSATAPQWADAAHTTINLTVDFEVLGLVPFTAHPQDCTDHGRYLFNAAAAGQFGPVAEFVPPAPVVPASLAMKQARLALLNAGLYDAVRAAVAAAPMNVQIEWEFSASVVRTDALVVALAAQLNLTEAQLDELFLAGSKL